jgi:hypothetical protein
MSLADVGHKVTSMCEAQAGGVCSHNSATSNANLVAVAPGYMAMSLQ